MGTKMEKVFETALNGLLNFDASADGAEARYNELFKQMVTSSMQICGEKDYAALVAQKAAAAEAKYGLKIDDAEDDAYKKLRNVVRFEMSRESAIGKIEHEICCTESNFANAVAMFRAELEKIVPESQKEVVDSMAYSLYSDFTKYFVCTVLDMVADAKIYQMEEFRPLQLNAMGKEVRTNVNALRAQASKPQKSKTVTDWFMTTMILPAFLFRKLYAVSLVEMFGVAQKQIDDAAHMFNMFAKIIETFAAGDEYCILKVLLKEMGLEDCFTVRPKVAKPAAGNAVVN